MDEMTKDTSIYPNGTIVADRYKIESFLAQGGMAQVYVATQQQINRLVALKVLSPMFSMNPGVVMRFFREAHVIGSLVHPNTVRIYDMGETPDKRMFIAMELLKGEELSERIKRGPMTPAEALPIVRQVAGSLSEAHQLGIIHRDLKPDNIFLTNMNVVKVLDFCIAKLKDYDNKGGKKLTKAGTAPGTPEYMSPEQARGKELDARADLYSLGVVLYEMLKGQPPFEEATFLGTILMHIQAAPPPLPDSVPLPLRNYVINRLLAKDPNSRPASAEVFIEEIDDLSRKLGLSGDDDSAKLKAEIESLRSEILQLKSGDTSALSDADLSGERGDGGRRLEISENIKVAASRAVSEKQQSMVRESGSGGAVPPKLPPQRVRAVAVPARAAKGPADKGARDASVNMPAVGQGQPVSREDSGFPGLRGQQPPVKPMPGFEEPVISGMRAAQSAPSMPPVPGKPSASKPVLKSVVSGGLVSKPSGVTVSSNGSIEARPAGMPEIPGNAVRMQSSMNIQPASPANMPGMSNGPTPMTAVPGMGMQPQAPGMGMQPQAPGMGMQPQVPGMGMQPQVPGMGMPSQAMNMPRQPGMYGTMINMPVSPGYMNGVMPGSPMYNNGAMGMQPGMVNMPGYPNMPAAPGPRMTQQGMAAVGGMMGGMMPSGVSPVIEDGDFVPYPRHMQAQMGGGMLGGGMAPMGPGMQPMGMPQGGGGYERASYPHTSASGARGYGGMDEVDMDRASAMSRPKDVMTGRAARSLSGSRDMKFMMFAQPLTQKAGKDKLGASLKLCKDIWNAVISGPKAISVMYNAAQDTPNLLKILHLMVDRKRECYADELWEIVDYELEERVDDKGNMRIGIQLETRDI